MSRPTSRLLDDSDPDVLAHGECVRLLRETSIGRLGLSAGSLPIILPLNFMVDGASIVFCTEPGPKLSAALAGDVVCLEVDNADATDQAGWSVLVTGRLREITDPAELTAAGRLPLTPWKPTVSPHFVRLSMELVSGRGLSHIHRGAQR